MEQLVARRAHNPKVAGSSPAPATLKIKELDANLAPFLFPCTTYVQQSELTTCAP